MQTGQDFHAGCSQCQIVNQVSDHGSCKRALLVVIRPYDDLEVIHKCLNWFWNECGRELPRLISVPLHISVGIHAEGELTHFADFTQPWAHCTTVDVRTFIYTMDDMV